MILEPKPIALSELLQKGLFQIPQYQRTYSWRKEQVEEFLEDLFSMHGQKKSWFLGIVYVYAAGDKRLEILDGQQRITTAFILLKELSLFHENITTDSVARKFKAYADQNLHSHLFLVGSQAPRLELGSLSIREFMAYLRAEKSEDARISYLNRGESAYTHKLLDETILAIRERLRSHLGANPGTEDDLERFQELVSFLLSEVRLIEIKLDSKASFHTIFEFINDRGRRLTASDKFKSLYCSMATNAEEFEKSWFSALSRLFAVQKDLDKDVFDFYYRSIGINDKGKFFYQLRQDLRKLDGDAKKVSALSNLFSQILDMVDLVESVANYNLYALYKGKKNDRLQRRAKVVNVLLRDVWANFNQVGVVVFASYFNFKKRDDIGEFETFLDNLSNAIRFYISAHLKKIQANRLRDQTIKIAAFMQKKGGSIESFLLANREFDSSRKLTFRNIDKLSFEDNKLSELLVKIIQAKVQPRVIEEFDPRQQWSLDHFLPIKWEKHWPEALDSIKAANNKFKTRLSQTLSKRDFSADGKNRVQEFLGNNFVISLGLNKLQSNLPLKAKQKKLSEASICVIMPTAGVLEDIRNAAKFDVEDIIERTIVLGELLLEALGDRKSF